MRRSITGILPPQAHRWVHIFVLEDGSVKLNLKWVKPEYISMRKFVDDYKQIARSLTFYRINKWVEDIEVASVIDFTKCVTMEYRFGNVRIG